MKTAVEIIENRLESLRVMLNKQDDELGIYECGTEIKVIKSLLREIKEHYIESVEQEAKPTLDEKYSELILTVQRKFDGETRHETALRYIREAESSESQGHWVEESYKV